MTKDPWDCHIPEAKRYPDADWILSQKPADEAEAAELDELWDELVSARAKEEVIRGARITGGRKIRNRVTGNEKGTAR